MTIQVTYAYKYVYLNFVVAFSRNFAKVFNNIFVFVYLQFLSAKLLQQCLVPTENRGYVVEKGLDKVINVAKKYTENTANIQHNQVGTGILEQLFRHSEVTCRY